jgi:hypothetical protein
LTQKKISEHEQENKKFPADDADGRRKKISENQREKREKKEK